MNKDIEYIRNDNIKNINNLIDDIKNKTNYYFNNLNDDINNIKNARNLNSGQEIKEVINDMHNQINNIKNAINLNSGQEIKDMQIKIDRLYKQTGSINYDVDNIKNIINTKKLPTSTNPSPAPNISIDPTPLPPSKSPTKPPSTSPAKPPSTSPAKPSSAPNIMSNDPPALIKPPPISITLNGKPQQVLSPKVYENKKTKDTIDYNNSGYKKAIVNTKVEYKKAIMNTPDNIDIIKYAIRGKSKDYEKMNVCSFVDNSNVIKLIDCKTRKSLIDKNKGGNVYIRKDRCENGYRWDGKVDSLFNKKNGYFSSTVNKC
tara:strand:+ start:13958 stop:14905 length:948 start_codon:yes stop_codon:yes gene_type:complete